MNKWGFLRETNDKAQKAGIDKDTGYHRTGLEDYLKVIFPKTDDWLHDKALGKIDGTMYRCRPDYRSEELKLIVEFDGLPHYTNPDIIEKDLINTELYASFGYKVVRIPYFIQLTNEAVKTLFDIEVSEDLFDGIIPSLGIKGRNTPAYLCPAGIERMANEFKEFPDQYQTNIEALRNQGDTFKSGIDFLETEYNKIN
ncbi:DUF559 domain-containing protein [Alkalitalea saponilacus]|uniref:DUF559 domain-containing protein n=1 Tax=Alkalitalea saponilacus TaxID=889453 RepID=A0A1T5HUJ1_9BACT|nr:DUF559 domain-containing protein [Alkalitalea saponilacus]ASB50399.1 hypothetical protein CDL62_15220 [Alkalitalea saponilacus]SKC24317.1 Protein of unknown function [Alkalitalea saponilacus]